MKRTLIAAVLAAVAMPLLAEETPEKAVAAYFAGMTATNFEAAAKQVHPTELLKMRDAIVPFLEKSVQTNGFPAGLRAFTREDTVETIVKLTPEEVFVRLMSWRSTVQPMWLQFQKRTIAPIGSVKEGEVMHVVCRQTTGPAETATARMVVFTAMKDKSEWKIVPPPDILMMPQDFIRMGATPRPSPRTPSSATRTPPSSWGPIAPREPPPPKAPGALTPGQPAPPTQTPAPAPAAPVAPAPAAPAAK